ncbi:hypothetical protein ES705_37534 [subsurface metagenome]
MSSREIAELTGKNHKDVMRSIREMEPAWVKMAGRNFALGEYLDANKQLRPEYHLSKTECLYIATKFNDEARAKLVLRWEELEKKAYDFTNPDTVLQLAQNWKEEHDKRIEYEYLYRNTANNNLLDPESPQPYRQKLCLTQSPDPR